MSNNGEKGEKLTAAGCWGIVDVGAGNNGPVAANAERNTWEGGRAREDVTSLGCTVGSTGDLGIVGCDSGGREIQKRRTGVGDAVNRGRDKPSRANGISASSEFPEAIGGVDRGVSDTARVFAGIDVAKVVVARLTFLQVGSEERGSKSGYGIFEECRHLVWARCVDAVECQAKQPITRGVRLEFCTDCFRCLDSLAGHGGTTNHDFIDVDVA